MENKGRAVIASLLVAAGVGLLAYGLFRNAIAVSSKPVTLPAVPGVEDELGPMTVLPEPEIVSEPAITQEVARGGVTRDESGQITKTYEGTQAPQACPT
jgi:hypothetical protein